MSRQPQNHAFSIACVWHTVNLLDRKQEAAISPPPDDSTHPALLDHIGQALTKAAQTWKADFEQRMTARGHAVIREAASNALAFIGPQGISQSRLARAMGVSKQAAQQFTDRLAALGLVTRAPDPTDSRANRVLLTLTGQQMMTEANAVKSAIEAGYRSTMGNSAFAFLKATLNHLPKI